MTQKLSCALKGTLATVNIFFVATGVITLYVGISSFLAVQTYQTFWRQHWDPPGYFDQAIVFIATGVFILLVAIVGFYAVIRENYLLIVAYIAAMGIVLILHLSASISSFSIREEKLASLPEHLQYSMKVFGEKPYVAKHWYLLQQDFECCGTNSPNEWLAIFSTQESLAVPLSCCSSGVVHTSSCTVETAHSVGCSDLFVNFIQASFDAVGYGGLFLAFMQALMILNVVSALWMVKAAR